MTIKNHNKYATNGNFWKHPQVIKIFFILLLILFLAILIMPNIKSFQCRSAQSEAKHILSLIYQTQKLYYANNLRYTNLHDLIENNLIKFNAKNYIYEGNFVNEDSFVMIATGKKNTIVSGDQWSINENNKLTHLFNSCTKK